MSLPSNCGRPATPAPRAFTLIELLVVIAIIAVMAAIALPIFGRVQANSQAVKCASNLRQIGGSLNLFVADNNGCLPAAKDDAGLQWSKQLGPYLPQRGKNDTSPENAIFICPAAVYTGYKNSNLSRTYTTSGAMLYFATQTGGGTSTPPTPNDRRKPSTMLNSSGTILVAEGKLPAGATSGACDSATNWTTAAVDFGKATSKDTIALDFRHSDSMNLMYADGHVGKLLFTDRATVTQPLWEGR